MDIAFHDDFEQGDTQTYTVELPESVRLDELEFALRKTPCFDFLPGITDDWHCENIRITPLYAGYEQTAPIDIGGVQLKGICQSIGMNFQTALKGGKDPDYSNKQFVTNLKVEIKVKDELYAGTDSDIYVKGVWGSTYWRSVVLDKGEGHNDLERGDTEVYNIPITNYGSGTARGIPLNELYVEFKHDGIDEANWENVKITPCYGSVELTEPISLGGQVFEGKTWATDFQRKLKNATYRDTDPDLSQTVTDLKVQIIVADELWAGTDSDIYLNVYSGDSQKPLRRVLLDKDGYNDFEQGDNDIYTVSLSGSAAGIPVNQLRLEFEHTGTDEANWAEVLVTPYNGSKALTEAISLGGQTFQCIFWDTDFQTRLKLHYNPIALEYKTNLDGGLLSYMDSLDGGEERVDEKNELWTKTKLREDIFFKIFKGFSPEIEYTGDSTVEENEWYTLELDLTGVWNGVSMDRRSQVKDFQHTPPVEGSVLVEFINEEGKYVHQQSLSIGDNKATLANQTPLEPGNYDLRVTYKPSYDAQYAKSEAVIFPRALQVTPAKYQVVLQTDGTPGCTVSGGGTVQKNTSITITASTGPVYNGYKFKEWRMGGVVIGTDATMSFTPFGDCMLMACFEPEICTVTINGGVSTVQAKLGTQAKLTAEASAAFQNPSYQYYILYPGRTTWEALAGSKNGTINIPATAECDGARVKVEATDSIGRKATSEVKFVIAEPVAIKTQPKNVTTSIGGKATFKVVAQYGKAPYTYKWQFRSSNTAEWIDVDAGWGTGFDSDSFTVTAELNRICKGNEYRCIVTDATGAFIASNAAHITSSDFAVQIENGESEIVYDAHSGHADPREIHANVAGGTAPVTFTWYTKSGRTGQWEKASTDATFVLEPTMTWNFYLKVEAKDANGNVVTSNEVYIELHNIIVN